jgi:hypothetical protein
MYKQQHKSNLTEDGSRLFAIIFGYTELGTEFNNLKVEDNIKDYDAITVAGDHSLPEQAKWHLLYSPF